MEIDKGGDHNGAAGSRNAITLVVNHGDPHSPFNRTTLRYDRGTAELVSTQRFEYLTRAQRLRMMVVPIHRGEILGTFGRVIAALACAATLLLVYTGVALSWHRLIRPLFKQKAAAQISGQGTKTNSVVVPSIAPVTTQVTSATAPVVGDTV